MSTDSELKRKLGSMLGASMLATTLSAVPVHFDPTNLSIHGSYAFAESGNSGSGEGGDNDSDSNSGPGSGGESGDNSGPGSGGESGDNSGPGSGGESGENSGPGNSGKNSGRGNSRGKNGGKKGRGGFFKSLFFGKNRGRSNKTRHSTSRSIPSRFGRVVRSRTSSRGTEVKYSDGWSEKIRDGRYQLLNPKGRVVVSRRVRNSDKSRLKTAVRK